MDDTQTQATPAVGDDLVRSIAGMLNRDPATITQETRFFEDLSFDSTSILVLLMQVENELGIEFDPDELEPDDLETVGKLVSFIRRQTES